ncbi:MAG: amidohydrolase [Hyphomicrobiales bacterium]|nr:amidohydrolase [Hyphomicrobiales bacterium]
MKVDVLLTNGTVLTMDDAFRVIEAGCVAIKDGVISHIGAVPAGIAADAIVDAQGGLIAPGFINTHCHAAMSLLRGLADNVVLKSFLNTVWEAERNHITPETAYLGAKLSAAEMALGGVTHFLDMYWYVEATVVAAGEVGLGLSAGPAMIGVPGPEGSGWEDTLAAARDFAGRHAANPLVDVMLVPHGCYTLDASKLRDVRALSAELSLPVHIHAAEAAWELELVRNTYGQSPVRALRDAGLLGGPLLLAHAVHLDDAEISMLAEAGSAVAHCPASNAKLASGMASVRALLDAGVTLSLGTDGPSTGNDLDMFKAMRLTAYLHALRTGSLDTLAARDIVAMATIGGAKALGLSGRQGSLEVGKQADVVVVRADAPHMAPIYDPYSALVYSAGREDVAHVFARSRPVVRDGKLVTPVEDLTERVGRLAAEIAKGIH